MSLNTATAGLRQALNPQLSDCRKLRSRPKATNIAEHSGAYEQVSEQWTKYLMLTLASLWRPKLALQSVPETSATFAVTTLFMDQWNIGAVTLEMRDDVRSTQEHHQALLHYDVIITHETSQTMYQVLGRLYHAG